MKYFHKLYARKKKNPSKLSIFIMLAQDTIKAKISMLTYQTWQRKKETTHLCVKQAILKMNYMANVKLNRTQRYILMSLGFGGKREKIKKYKYLFM